MFFVFFILDAPWVTVEFAKGFVCNMWYDNRLSVDKDMRIQLSSINQDIKDLQKRKLMQLFTLI